MIRRRETNRRLAFLPHLTAEELDELCTALDSQLGALMTLVEQSEAEPRFEAIRRAGVVASLCTAAHEARMSLAHGEERS